MTGKTVALGKVVLPVAGECSEELAARVADGQPIVFTVAGRPRVVAVDVDSWAEVEEALGLGRPEAPAAHDPSLRQRSIRAAAGCAFPPG